MHTYILYEFKDCDLFTPIQPFENWHLIIDHTPKKNPIGVLLPNGVVLDTQEAIKPYIQKARLPLLFPVHHLVIEDYNTHTFQECLQKNTPL